MNPQVDACDAFAASFLLNSPYRKKPEETPHASLPVKNGEAA
jgi:hypothetical protein